MTRSPKHRNLEAATLHGLQPISEAAPCGPSLEYDPDYIVLQARLRPAPEVQYGNFTARPAVPEWADVERQCRALLARSRDITLLLWLLRCRIHGAGIGGARDGLVLLAESLERFAADIHPQVEAGDPPDLSVRANALAGLVDPEGLLADLRGLVVTSHLGAPPLTLRDIERARALPRPADALAPEAVAAELERLRGTQTPQWEAFQAAATAADRIAAWSAAQLSDQAPDLSALVRLLSPFKDGAGAVRGSGSANEALMPEVAEPVAPLPSAAQISTASMHEAQAPQVDRPLQARQDASAAIATARRWFELHEPSSPVGLLLRQAERLVGRPYAEVAQAIPPDLIVRWSEPG